MSPKHGGQLKGAAIDPNWDNLRSKIMEKMINNKPLGQGVIRILEYILERN